MATSLPFNIHHSTFNLSSMVTKAIVTATTSNGQQVHIGTGTIQDEHLVVVLPLLELTSPAAKMLCYQSVVFANQLMEQLAELTEEQAHFELLSMSSNPKWEEILPDEPQPTPPSSPNPQPSTANSTHQSTLGLLANIAEHEQHAATTAANADRFEDAIRHRDAARAIAQAIELLTKIK